MSLVPRVVAPALEYLLCMSHNISLTHYLKIHIKATLENELPERSHPGYLSSSSDVAIQGSFFGGV
jgi:hypothetical protein